MNRKEKNEIKEKHEINRLLNLIIERNNDLLTQREIEMLHALSHDDKTKLVIDIECLRGYNIFELHVLNDYIKTDLSANVLEKLKNDKYFRNAIWALGISEGHTSCNCENCMYGDLLASIETFFKHEWGLTHDKIKEIAQKEKIKFDALIHEVKSK